MLSKMKNRYEAPCSTKLSIISKEKIFSCLLLPHHASEFQRRFFKDFEVGIHNFVATFGANDRPFYMT